MPTGVSGEFDQAIADEICERLAKGLSLRKILGPGRDAFLPGQNTVFKWLEENAAFAKQYARARELQADAKFDEAWEIAESATVEDVQVSRLKIDTIKWQTAKLAPKKYGEKIAHVGGGEGDDPIRTESRVDLSGLTADQLRALASIKLPSEA
jgi:hypothetical protein